MTVVAKSMYLFLVCRNLQVLSMYWTCKVVQLNLHSITHLQTFFLVKIENESVDIELMLTISLELKVILFQVVVF